MKGNYFNCVWSQCSFVYCYDCTTIDNEGSSDDVAFSFNECEQIYISGNDVHASDDIIRIDDSIDILVESNNLIGPAYHSLDLDHSTNSTISMNNITNVRSFHLYSCDNLTMSNNIVNLVNYSWGYMSGENMRFIENSVTSTHPSYLNIRGCKNSEFLNNTFVNCSFDFGVLFYGPWTLSFSGNTINNVPIGYFENENSIIIGEMEYAQLIFVYCDDVRVYNLTYSNLATGIFACYCDSVLVQNVTFLNCIQTGLSCHFCGVVAQNCTFRDCGYVSANIDEASFCKIKQCFFSSSQSQQKFVWVRDTNDLEFCNCTFLGNFSDIEFSDIIDGMFNNCLIMGENLWVRFSGCEEFSIIENMFHGSHEISVSHCTDSKIINNEFGSSILRLYGWEKEHWNLQCENNTINEKELGYFRYLEEISIDCGKYGQIILFSCENIVIEGRNIQFGGIQVAYCSNCGIIDAEMIMGNYGEIEVEESTQWSIERCLINGTSHTYGFSSIWIRDTPNTRITENIFLNLTIGISGSNAVVQSNIMNCTYNSLRVDSDNSVVANNTVYGTGIFLGGDNAIIYNCIVIEAIHTGFMSAYSENLTISNLKIYNSSDSGIGLRNVETFVIQNCIIIGNGGCGIWLGECKNGEIHKNRIYNNDYGIYVTWESNNQKIWNNAIGWNSLSNAVDYVGGNSWDNGVNLGNYWSDYDGEGVYEIEGGCSSVDRYPRSLPYADLTPPMIDHPNDLIVELGSKDNTIVWKASDDYPRSFEIYKNGTLIDEGEWNVTSFIVSVDDLDLGTYNFTLVVFDILGSNSKDTVFVTVVGEIPITSSTSSNSTMTTTSIIPSMILLGGIIISIVAVGIILSFVIIMRLESKN